MRSRFYEQLTLLNKELIQMASMCEEAIALSAKALLEGDAELAQKVSPVECEIDRLERNIESMCLKLLLQQQPVAKDLRQISAALKMITDIERIGDQAADIAEIITYLGGARGADCEYIAQWRVRSSNGTERRGRVLKARFGACGGVVAHDDVGGRLL